MPGISPKKEYKIVT